MGATLASFQCFATRGAIVRIYFIFFQSRERRPLTVISGDNWLLYRLRSRRTLSEDTILIVTVVAGPTSTGSCDNSQAGLASRILCYCWDPAELRSCLSGKHFMEPSDLDKIPLCNILYLAGDTQLLAEWKTWGCSVYQKMVAVHGTLFLAHPTHSNLSYYNY
jgi:hypothetical protein